MVVRGRRPQYRCGEVVDGGSRGEWTVANARRRRYQGAVPVVATAATVCARAALRRRRLPANTASNCFGGDFSGALARLGARMHKRGRTRGAKIYT